MEDQRGKLPNGALAKVLAKPLRRLSNSFFAATARREIQGDLLHRTELPPTLQGFFYGHRHSNVEEEEEDVDLMPASQEFRHFAAKACDEFYDDEDEDEEEEEEEEEDEDEDEDEDEEEEDDDDDEMPLPPKEFGSFASIVGTSTRPVAMDHSFSFMTKVLHQREHIFLLDSCNGLVLLGLLRDPYYGTQQFGYIVCNPATEQWVRVPTCTWIEEEPTMITVTTHSSLLFNPAVSSHFHVVLFWENVVGLTTGTNTHCYSSETGVWVHNMAYGVEEMQDSLEGWRLRDITHNSILCDFPSAFVEGLLHLILDRKQVLQVDAQGQTRQIIPHVPHLVHVGADNNYMVFIGQSQGLLHCIVEEGQEYIIRRARIWKSYGLSVWVLPDLDAQQWILKHQMSNLELFGMRSCEVMVDYHVITMHPDCNLIYFVRHKDCQMLSYDMDRQKVCALQSFRDYYGPSTLGDHITFTPYIPYSSELFVGVVGAHKEAIEELE